MLTINTHTIKTWTVTSSRFRSINTSSSIIDAQLWTANSWPKIVDHQYPHYQCKIWIIDFWQSRSIDIRSSIVDSQQATVDSQELCINAHTIMIWTVSSSRFKSINTWPSIVDHQHLHRQDLDYELLQTKSINSWPSIVDGQLWTVKIWPSIMNHQHPHYQDLDCRLFNVQTHQTLAINSVPPRSRLSTFWTSIWMMKKVQIKFSKFFMLLLPQYQKKFKFHLKWQTLIEFVISSQHLQFWKLLNIFFITFHFFVKYNPTVNIQISTA